MSFDSTFKLGIWNMNYFLQILRISTKKNQISNSEWKSNSNPKKSHAILNKDIDFGKESWRITIKIILFLIIKH